MTLIVACPSCGTKLKAPENLIGKKVRCPKCSMVFAVAAPEPESIAPAVVEDPAPARRRREVAQETAPEPPEEESFAFDEESEERRPRKKQRVRGDEFNEASAGLAGLSNEYSISMGEWFRYAGSHYTSVLGPIIGYMLIGMVISPIVMVISLVGAIAFVGPVIFFFLMPALAAGFTVVCLAQLKGKSWSFGDFFSGFQWYVPLILNNLLWWGIAVAISLIPLILTLALLLPAILAAAHGKPVANIVTIFLALMVLFFAVLAVAIYLAIRLFWFAVPLIIDRGCGPIAAVKGSWTLSRGHFWGLLGMAIVLGLINMAGSMCCIGPFFTVPYTLLAYHAGYLLIAGTKGPVTL
jgi:hypothetical protein